MKKFSHADDGLFSLNALKEFLPSGSPLQYQDGTKPSGKSLNTEVPHTPMVSVASLTLLNHISMHAYSMREKSIPILVP